MSKSERGFTLVEALVAMGILLFVLLSLATAYEVNQSTYRQAEDQIDLQQNARLAMTEIARSVRMAGYFPENFGAGPSRSHPVQIGTERAVALHGDTDGNGASEVVLYCRVGETLRRVRAAEGSAGAYLCVGGEVIAEHVTDLRFEYLDADGAPLPDSTDAAFALDGEALGAVPEWDDATQRDGVRRISISLTTSADAPPGKLRPAYTIATVVELRNAG